MDGNAGVGSKPIGSGPKARICYICGRQYMLHSYEIHLKQCKELWIAREEQKPERERKPLPEDPALRLQGSGGAGKGKKKKSSDDDEDDGVGSPSGTEGLSLDEINKLASEAFNNDVLSQCAYCGRTFLPEKLAIHNKSCTAENPARRVSEGVRKGTDVPKISAPTTARPKTGSRPTPSAEPSDSPTEEGPLAGHIGGAAGRGLRKAHAVAKLSHKREGGEESQGGSFSSREEAVEYLNSKVEYMEGMVDELVKAISDIKETIAHVSRMS